MHHAGVCIPRIQRKCLPRFGLAECAALHDIAFFSAIQLSGQPRLKGYVFPLPAHNVPSRSSIAICSGSTPKYFQAADAARNTLTALERKERQKAAASRCPFSPASGRKYPALDDRIGIPARRSCAMAARRVRVERYPTLLQRSAARRAFPSPCPRYRATFACAICSCEIYCGWVSGAFFAQERFRSSACCTGTVIPVQRFSFFIGSFLPAGIS